MTSLQLQLQRDYVLSRQEQLRVYLSNQCRPDGREFEALKPIVLSSGGATRLTTDTTHATHDTWASPAVIS